MKQLVIKLKYGGIGDNLFFSHIPRIAKQFGGYDKVYVSKHSPYLGTDTKRLVWELNPFIDGFTDLNPSPPNISLSVDPEMNILDKLMLSYGLDDGLRFHEPEIYYKPKIVEELKNAIIYDPNFGTTLGHPSIKQISGYLVKNCIKIDYQMVGGRTHKGKLCDRVLGGIPTLKSDDLFNFVDILYSCKTVYCFITGTLPLTAAIGKSSMILYVDGGMPIFRHSKLHNYINLGEH